MLSEAGNKEMFDFHLRHIDDYYANRILKEKPGFASGVVLRPPAANWEVSGGGALVHAAPPRREREGGGVGAGWETWPVRPMSQ